MIARLYTKFKIPIISNSTKFKVLAELMVNLASGWFGVVLISPGLFGVASVEEYLGMLIANLPFGIVGLLIALWLAEKAKHYEFK